MNIAMNNDVVSALPLVCCQQSPLYEQSSLRKACGSISAYLRPHDCTPAFTPVELAYEDDTYDALANHWKPVNADSCRLKGPSAPVCHSTCCNNHICLIHVFLKPPHIQLYIVVIDLQFSKSSSVPTMATVDTTSSVITLANNTWTKNEKIKTCKCDGCGNRVTDFSYQCSECLRHICSVCLDPNTKQTLRTKAFAQWHLTKHCFCKFRSHMDPKFDKKYAQEAPPHRVEEEKQARISRNLAASSRKPKTNKAMAAKHTALRDASPDSDDGRDIDVSDDVPGSPRRTIAATKPKREGLKRKQYIIEDENEDPDENFDEDATSNSKSKKQKVSKAAQVSSGDMTGGSMASGAASQLVHLHRATTVVIGAGVVGLFLARELALEANKAGIEHRIVVVELRQSCCELASGLCAGFLSTKGMPEDWSSLAEIAEECWFDMIASSDTRSTLAFSGNTKHQVVEGAGGGKDAAPRWLREEIPWALVEDEHALGRM